MMTTGTPGIRLYDSRGHLWQAIPGTTLLRRDDRVEMPYDRVLDIFGYGAGTPTAYLLGRFDRAALQPHTPDVDYLRGAREALVEMRRRLTHDGTLYPADAQLLKDAAAELGVTDWTEVDT